MSAAPALNSPWLFGKWRDLSFGCGLGYAALFVALLFFGRDLRLAQPPLLFSLAFVAISIPHYGATLLRVYERARDRRAYALFSIWATLALIAVFGGAVFSPALAAFLVTLYFTWSPWHYTGQNYGLAVMFLRRSGIAISGGEKRWLYASFVCSFVLVALLSHSEGVGVRGAGQYGGAQGIAFTPLGIPAALIAWLVPLALAGQGVALAVSAVLLGRRATLRALAPVLALWLAQSLWFTLPYLVLHTGWLEQLDALAWANNNHYFMWIALAHAAQYLWVTAYYAKQSGAQQSVGGFWLKASAAGALPWTLPLLVLWQPGFELLSPDGGVLLLVAAFANLHHFVLDGAIWKLRGRIAQVLIASQPDAEPAPARASWLGRAAWALCGAMLVAHLGGVFTHDAWQRALRAGDLAEARASLERLRWFGLDRGSFHLAIAQNLLRIGAFDGARAEARAALAADPASFQAQLTLGVAHEALGEARDAALAFDAALVHEPARVPLLQRSARAWRNAGEPARAIARLERAAALAPSDDSLRRELDRLRAARSDAP
jgi:tetratricopeptide (TPR) repeat protein